MLGFRPVDFERAHGQPLVGDIVDALPATTITAADVQALLMVEGDGVRLAPSIIPAAGMGVRVTRAVPKGTLITKYDGVLVKTRALNVLKASSLPQRALLSSHTIAMTLWLSVVANVRVGPPIKDGKDFLARSGLYPITADGWELAGKGLCGFINSLYDGDELLVPRGYNVRYVTVHDRMAGPRWMLDERDTGHVFIAAEATRDIDADEELFVFYNRVLSSADDAGGVLNIDPARFEKT